MESYHFVIMMTLTDGTHADGNFPVNSAEEGITRLHEELAYARRAENVAGCLCMVVRDDGVLIRDETWERQR